MPAVTLADVRALYRKADSFATEAGEFREEALIPAHNQLRYVGYHVLKALNDDGSVADQEHLYKAKGHCERAMYDAAEAALMASRDWIRDFRFPRERRRRCPEIAGPAAACPACQRAVDSANQVVMRPTAGAAH